MSIIGYPGDRGERVVREHQGHARDIPGDGDPRWGGRHRPQHHLGKIVGVVHRPARRSTGITGR
jgi:hypothetical protein